MGAIGRRLGAPREDPGVAFAEGQGDGERDGLAVAFELIPGDVGEGLEDPRGSRGFGIATFGQERKRLEAALLHGKADLPLDERHERECDEVGVDQPGDTARLLQVDRRISNSVLSCEKRFST